MTLVITQKDWAENLKPERNLRNRVTITRQQSLSCDTRIHPLIVAHNNSTNNSKQRQHRFGIHLHQAIDQAINEKHLFNVADYTA